MSEESWSFRVARGTVTVRNDEVGIDSTPRRFLASQRARWHHGDWRERSRVLVRVAVLPMLVLGVGFRLLQMSDPSAGPELAVGAVSILTLSVQFWTEFLRETTIPLSEVRRVELDEEEGTVAVVGDGSETELAVPATDDLREAREVFRLRGIPVESREERERGETTYRVDTRDGVCFCERCGSQVSPADRACPACGYALRVEREAQAGSGGEPGGSPAERSRETERNTA